MEKYSWIEKCSWNFIYQRRNVELYREKGMNPVNQRLSIAAAGGLWTDTTFSTRFLGGRTKIEEGNFLEWERKRREGREKEKKRLR